MALPVWPASLPREPKTDGYSRQKRFPPAVTEMEDGPVLARPRSRIRARRDTVNLVMDGSQLATFESFFDGPLRDGTLRFTMPTVEAGGGFADRTVHLDGERPKVVPFGDDAWQVTLSLTVYY